MRNKFENSFQILIDMRVEARKGYKNENGYGGNQEKNIGG